MKNILEQFEITVNKYSTKIAYTDNACERTFLEAQENAKKIASSLLKYGSKRAILLFIDKNCKCLDSMLGSLYAGDYYIVIDVHSPIERINKIISILDNPILLVDNDTKKIVKQLKVDNTILQYEKIVKKEIKEEALNIIRDKQIDLDIAYILFTSGSTGVPKGTVITHRSLISYIDWVTNEFKFDKKTVFGSQTPLYFSMSVTDFYSTLKCGCTFHMIPKSLFIFPTKLVEFLNNKKINTIYWVPTALSILSNWKVFDVIKPRYLKKVLFAGEVMPTKQLNYWINNLNPSILYANLFGPTETTDICTFYVVNRRFNDNESIPIGKHCDNCDAFIVKDDGREALVNEEGELYVRSSFMANGYFNDVKKTNKAFVQNPLNNNYPEIVYKTGDIVKMNDRNEIIYITRKDFQIKRSGYRIELGEIENNANSIENVKSCACVYNKDKNCLALFYTGGPKDETEMYNEMVNRVPYYMIPDKVIRINEMPKNANGKIDRNELIKKL